MRLFELTVGALEIGELDLARLDTDPALFEAITCNIRYLDMSAQTEA